jgi:uncharacterized membrane protein
MLSGFAGLDDHFAVLGRVAGRIFGVLLVVAAVTATIRGALIV